MKPTVEHNINIRSLIIYKQTGNFMAVIFLLCTDVLIVAAANEILKQGVGPFSKSENNLLSPQHLPVEVSGDAVSPESNF